MPAALPSAAQIGTRRRSSRLLKRNRTYWYTTTSGKPVLLQCGPEVGPNGLDFLFAHLESRRPSTAPTRVVRASSRRSLSLNAGGAHGERAGGPLASGRFRRGLPRSRRACSLLCAPLPLARCSPFSEAASTEIQVEHGLGGGCGPVSRAVFRRWGWLRSGLWVFASQRPPAAWLRPRPAGFHVAGGAHSCIASR